MGKETETMKTEITNDTAAKLMTLHDCVWQLGNTLRDCMNRLETIKETNPELCVERETAQAKHTLERYAKGPMFYKPHPFGWPFDAYVLRDAMAKFAPNQHEIQVPPLASGNIIKCPDCGEKHRPVYHDKEPCNECVERLIADSESKRIADEAADETSGRSAYNK